MLGSDTGLHPSSGAGRSLTLAVVTGTSGSEHVRRISERMAAASCERFALEAMRMPASADPEDPGPLIEAVLSGRADLAACCAERVPLALPSGIRLEAILRVGDPQYRLIAEIGVAGLDGLPPDSRLAACDETARAQVLFRHPTFEVELVTSDRLLSTGMSHGRWDAALLASPSWDVPHLETQVVTAVQIVPPSGRGVIALLASDRSDPAEPWRRLLNEPDMEDCLLCERAFLARMASGATGVAIAHAVRLGGRLELHGLLAHPDGSWLVSARASGPPSFGRILGLEVAESCRELASSRRVQTPAPRTGRSRA